MLLRELEEKASVIWRGQRDTPETIQRFKVCIRLLGPYNTIASIRTSQLDDLKDALYALPRIKSPHTINRYLATMSKALRWAAKRDLIANMPFVPWESEDPFRLTYFSEDEEALLLGYFTALGETHIATALRVLALTGLRVGELLALEAFDVDRGRIHIRDSKNKRDRFVPLQPPLDRALREAVRAGLPTYFVFNRMLTRAKEVTGVDASKGFHVYRHSCATRLTRLGVPTAVVKHLLGHRAISTTLKYAHVEEEALKAAVSLLYNASFAQAPALAREERQDVTPQSARLH